MAQDWTSFTLQIGVKADLETIYNAWTQAGEIEKWFLKTCTYHNADGSRIGRQQQATENCTYAWSWYLYDETENGRILQANGNDFFRFSFAGECFVDIELKETGGYVLVRLTQHNIPVDEESKFSIRIGCLSGWTFYLANLKSFYENGYDLRNKIPELKGVNN